MNRVLSPFHLFLAALFVNTSGDQLFNLAISIFVFKSSNSPFMLGLVFSSSYIGSILGYLLSPWLKQFNPIKVLNFTDLSSGFAAIAVCMAPLHLIALFQVVLGALRAVQKPVLQKMANKFVDEKNQLIKINALMQMTVQIATLIGILVASIAAVSQEMAKMILWFNAVSFLISLVLLISLREKFKEIKLSTYNKFSWGRELVAPVRLILQKDAFFLFVPTSFALGLNVALNSQLVNFAQQFSNPDKSFIIIESGMAIGLILGSRLIFNRGFKNETLVSMRSNVVFWGRLLSLALFIASFSGKFPYLAIFFIISAISDSMSAVHQSTMALEVFAGDSLHQALSLRFLLRQLSKALATFLLGLVISMFGCKNGFMIASVLLFCCFIPNVLFSFFRESVSYE